MHDVDAFTPLEFEWDQEMLGTVIDVVSTTASTLDCDLGVLVQEPSAELFDHTGPCPVTHSVWLAQNKDGIHCVLLLAGEPISNYLKV